MDADSESIRHLVTRFSAQSENLATESLCYILGQSSEARRALLRFVSQYGSVLDDDLHFHTQQGQDGGARPDMVGRDVQGRELLIIAAKFWAGLTDQQPAAYLRALPDGRDALLLFLAPQARFTTLWAELVRRCREAEIPLDQAAFSDDVWRGGRAGGHTLAIASWRSLLGLLLAAVEAEGQVAVAADIRQLQGLCEHMDETAFLPLRSEELTGNTGTRILQYCALADDLTNWLVDEHGASTKGLKATPGVGSYSRYKIVHDFGCALQFSSALGSHDRPTPLWFMIRDRQDHHTKS